MPHFFDFGTRFQFSIRARLIRRQKLRSQFRSMESKCCCCECSIPVFFRFQHTSCKEFGHLASAKCDSYSNTMQQVEECKQLTADTAFQRDQLLMTGTAKYYPIGWGTNTKTLWRTRCRFNLARSIHVCLTSEPKTRSGRRHRKK